MMKFYLLIITSLCFFSLSATAQNEEEAKVKASIHLLFAAISKADTSMMRSAFAPSATLSTISNTKSDGVKVYPDEINDFILNLANRKAGDLEEAFIIDQIRIDGDLAQAWVPYSFYYTDKFLHCGVNAITLVRFNGIWKIQSIIDTRRKDDCVYKK